VQTAAAPAPDPSPTPTTFQQASCPESTLSNRLMPAPAGSVPLTGLPSTYTDDSYASSVYTGSGVASVEQTLGGDQVTSILSESFAIDAYAKASQVIVLQTRTDTQARNLLTTLSSTSGNFPDSFTVPGYPQAVGTYTTTAPSGSTIVDGCLYAQAGNLHLSMWFGFNGSFDIATAQSWAATELDLLTAHTQDRWGFPIPTVSTPTLAPFAADPGTASTLSGCLMSLPSGAKASSTAAGSNPQDPGVDGFVDALYPNRSGYEET
jgi:hypothetical protein